MKEFKAGEYYVFSDTKKKAGKATIYGFVQVNGKPYAVMTITDEASTPVARLIKHDNDRAYIEVFSGCLNANAPVQPKVVKFKVGKIYSDYEHNVFSVVDKYTPYKGETHLVLDDRFIAKVEVKDNVEYASFVYSDGSLINLAANKYLEI